MNASRHLVVAAVPGQPLTPEQRRFNQLLAKLEKAKAELQTWQEQSLRFAQGFAARVQPLRDELLRCQATLIRGLEDLLGKREPKWTKTDRRRLGQELCDLAAGLVDATEDEALAEEMKAVFERHAGHDIETENRHAAAAMKDLFESMAGVDLGDEAFDSEEDLLREVRQRMAQASEALQQRRAKRKPSAAERKREREQREASQSLREVYRKLAAAIHPDRADDEADRERRHALMQRANQAHDAQDLLALLSLQLEIEQVDAAQLARSSAERARQYAWLLSEQLREIEAELGGRRQALCREFELDTLAPPRAAQLGPLLERLVREHRADLAQAQRDLAQIADPAGARAFLRQRWHEQDRDNPF